MPGIHSKATGGPRSVLPFSGLRPCGQTSDREAAGAHAGWGPCGQTSDCEAEGAYAADVTSREDA